MCAHVFHVGYTPMTHKLRTHITYKKVYTGCAHIPLILMWY